MPSSSLTAWRRPHFLRSAILSLGTAILLICLLSTAIRDAMLTHYHLLSAAVLLLASLLLLTARLAVLAPLLAVGTFLGLRAASAMKEEALDLPVSYLDIVTTVRNPLIPLLALGYRGPAAVPALLAAVALVALAVIAIRRFGLPSWSRVSRRIIEMIVVGLPCLFVLDAAGRDLQERLPALYPAIEQELWESGGQKALARAVGPIIYLAFTRRAGDAAAVGLAEKRAPRLPLLGIAAAQRQLLQFAAAPSMLPNVLIFHAESTFDPNKVFNLTAPVERPIWERHDETRALGPLRVNVVGGGSWVTEFEVLTGVDSRSFGYQGFYTHRMLGPRVRMALPKFLAAHGYSTAAYYTERAEFFGVGKAFANYGFQAFQDSQALGLKPDWSDSDAEVAQHVIESGAFRADPRPRFLFVSSQENHGPHACIHFTSPAELTVRFAGSASFDQDCSLNEYIRRAASTSEAFESMLGELRRLERETGRPFVFLVYGDHQPWSFTDGKFSIAGGVADDAQTVSFARFRKADNGKVTFYHLLASRTDVSFTPPPGPVPVPVTLLPTLVSAFAMHDPGKVYLPVNLFLYARCGSDVRARGCSLKHDAELWGQDWLFNQPDGHGR